MKLGFLRKLLSRFRNAPQEDFQPPPRLSLAGLPTEIIGCIANYLPVSSAACLALCNHSFQQRLGTRHWDALRPGDSEEEAEERGAFLSLVAQDLPSYIFCYQCSRLHHEDEIRSPGPIYHPLKLLPCCEDLQCLELDSHVTGWTAYKLSFPHVQIAMKRHRQGADHGISLNDLAFTEVQNSFQEDREYMTLLSVDARIRPSGYETFLLMRVQQVLLVPVDGFCKAPSTLFRGSHLGVYVHISPATILPSIPGSSAD